MRYDYTILGAGAIGSILGAHLAKAGHSVAMLARGPRARAIRDRGLRIQGLTDITVPVATITDPQQLRRTAVLIVAMKTPGTAEALESLRHVEIGVAWSIQNGPLKDEFLEEVFGAQRVLGALADTSGELQPDGKVLFTRNENVFVGELSGELSARAQRAASDLNAAGVRATAVAQIRGLEWSKFAAWVGLMALSLTTRALTWRYLSDPDAALVLVRLVREVGRLMDVLNIERSDSPVLPVATLCQGSEEEAVALLRRVGRNFELTAPQHRMSSLQDLEAGRPLEVHETLGYALRAAELSGVAMPLMTTFYHVIAGLDRMRRVS